MVYLLCSAFQMQILQRCQTTDEVPMGTESGIFIMHDDDETIG
jgi:hypothetical protein